MQCHCKILLKMYGSKKLLACFMVKIFMTFNNKIHVTYKTTTFIVKCFEITIKRFQHETSHFLIFY